VWAGWQQLNSVVCLVIRALLSCPPTVQQQGEETCFSRDKGQRENRNKLLPSSLERFQERVFTMLNLNVCWYILHSLKSISRLLWESRFLMFNRPHMNFVWVPHECQVDRISKWCIHVFAERSTKVRIFNNWIIFVLFIYLFNYWDCIQRSNQARILVKPWQYIFFLTVYYVSYILKESWTGCQNDLPTCAAA